MDNQNQQSAPDVTNSPAASELIRSTGSVFGRPARELEGKMLKNKHTGCLNEVMRVSMPSVIFVPGTVHDAWTLEDVEKHYDSPYSPDAKD